MDECLLIGFPLARSIVYIDHRHPLPVRPFFQSGNVSRRAPRATHDSLSVREAKLRNHVQDEQSRLGMLANHQSQW
jgi:hypothetical protein